MKNVLTLHEGRSLTVTFMSLFMCGLLVTSAQAQSSAPSEDSGGPVNTGGKGNRRFSDIELMKRFDLDGNGRLDREEREPARRMAIELKAESQRGRGRRGGPPRGE
ncbi:MAG TPA: hypothetical protein DCX60_02055, partial [Phycisphaerales bacterium]|nr:hypothetical protein [Phycisphaerales bacterium]